jgi:uncharacterized protein (TIGR02646 family)
MIKINKGNEPTSWRVYSLTPGVAYQASEDLRDALLKDQGHICAYCMRTIPVKDVGNSETSHIEHIKCRARYKELELEYSNLVICCPGIIDGTKHCDRAKGNLDILFNLFHPALQNSITYSSKDGKIKSSNTEWDNDINQKLKLNNKRLKYNRQYALDGIRFILEKKSWRRSELESILHDWSVPDQDGKLKSYCGVVIWYLEKKLRQQ